MTQVLSKALEIDQFVPETELQPSQAHFQQYRADTSSDAGASWFINSPGRGALLDSEAYIQYRIGFATNAGVANVQSYFRQMFGQTDNINSSDKFALRHGWAMHHAMQAISVNVNGTVINELPDRYSHELMRFYATPKELMGICSMSGGAPDSGSYVPFTKGDIRMTTTAPVTPVAGNALPRVVHHNGYDQFVPAGYPGVGGASQVGLVVTPVDDEFINKGFQDRYYRFMKYARHGGDGLNVGAGAQQASNANAAQLCADVFYIDIYERIPCAPFMIWGLRDEKRSIPNIDKLEIRINWNSNARQQFLQMLVRSAAGDAVNADGKLNTANIFVDYAGNGTVPGAQFPELHLKWYIPPQGFVATMPREISIPIKEIKYNVLTQGVLAHADTAHRTEYQSGTYGNIRLEQIPDLMLIYVKPDPSSLDIQAPSDFHCEIRSIEISVDGDSGKLLQADGPHLFAMFVKNAANSGMMMHDYNEWRKRYCTIAVRPEDLGLRQGPGINHPVTLTIRLEYASWWNYPQHATQPYKDQDALVTAAGANLQRTAGADFNFWQRAGAAPNGRNAQIHVVSQFEKYELTLSMAGGSRRKLLALAPPSVSGVPAPAPEQTDLRGVF